MFDDEKRNIRTLLKTINRTGTTLLDNGEGTMYLLEHADREDIENRNPQKQDGFNCILKFSTEGLSTEIINKIKEGIQNGTIRDQKTVNRRIKDCLRGQGSYVSDSIDAEDRATNADNVRLDSEAQLGESLGEQSHQNSSENSGTGFIRVYENDGTKGARYIPIDAQESGIDSFQTSDGEIYGFVDADGEVYFDKDAKGFSSEHVVHEYTHLWDRVIQKKNPKFWAINRAKRTLADTGGDFLFLVDHTDRDGLEHLEEGQEGFLCKAKIDITGLSREEIQTIKNESLVSR